MHESLQVMVRRIFVLAVLSWGFGGCVATVGSPIEADEEGSPALPDGGTDAAEQQLDDAPDLIQPVESDSIPDINPPSRLSTKFACTGQSRPTDVRMFNVGTFNIGKGDDGVKAQKVAEYFETYDLDLIALQELYPYGSNDEQDVVKDIPIEFGKRFPNQLFYYYSRLQNTGHSLMTVSKFPIEDQSYVDIAGGRSTIQTLVSLPFGKVRVFDTHLQRKEDSQCKGLNNSLDFIQQTVQSQEPFLLAGDYNLEKNQVFTSCGEKPAAMLSQSCSSTPCEMGGIDFVLGGVDSGPVIFQVCRFSTPLTDAHEIYVSTMELK